ncbi:MAG: hypothetical protein M3445_08625 [Actinomycetota bacterium]|nr:hypothetical protein [Actinomycetota bacterium]
MADDETQPSDDATPPAALGDAGKQALDRMKAERNQAAKDAKAATQRAADAETELTKLREANQSEQEKAVEAARKEGYTAGKTDATKEVGSLLVDAEFRAATTGRLTDEQRDALLENVDRTRFIGTDGAVDRGALTGWVDKIAPVPVVDEDKGNTHQRRPIESMRPGAAPAASAPADTSPGGLIRAGLAESSHTRN